MKKSSSSIENLYSVNIKPFKVKDIFVYLALLFFVATLFLLLFFSSKNQAKGFVVLIGDRQAFSLDYFTNSYVIEDEFSSNIVVDTNSFTITFFQNDDKSEFNVIKYDINSKSVFMLESSCSNTKECVNSPAISNAGIIFCAPHNLRILPIANAPTPPTVGGAYV